MITVIGGVPAPPVSSLSHDNYSANPWPPCLVTLMPWLPLLRLSLDGPLDEVDRLHVSFHTSSASYDMDLAHVNLWAPDAKLVVHEGGSTREVPPPKLPAYKGHLTNVTRHGPGASVTATVRPDGTLHIHIYEDGQDVVLESASGFNSVPQNKASIPVNGYILYNTSSVLDSALAKDEVLHHSSTPLPGLHVPRRTTHDDHGHHHIGRRDRKSVV